ncbi:DMT family transporter [Archaeoglobus sp.]
MRCLTVAVSAVLMGSLAIFVRSIDADPLTVTFFRMTFGLIYLLPAIKLIRFSLFKNLRVLLLSFVSLLTIAFYISSIQLVEMAVSAILLYMAPVYVIIFMLFRGEKVDRTSIFSLVTALIGLFLLLSPYYSINVGIIFGILAGVCYAGYFLLAKDVRSFASSLEITFITLLVSSIILAPAVSSNILIVLQSKLLWLLGLGLIPTAIPFVLLNYGIKFCKKEIAPIIALIEPVSAGIFGFLFFKEVLTVKQLLGAFLILSSVFIALRSGVES